MHKCPIPIADDLPSSRRKSKPLRTASFVLLGFLLAPLVVEGTWFCFAQWSQIMGKNTDAKTPMLDALHEHVQTAHESFWDGLTPWFQYLPWDPTVVLSIAAVLMAFAIRMLKL
jgi:hypothetical protein